jgi:hypothetical protein
MSAGLPTVGGEPGAARLGIALSTREQVRVRCARLIVYQRRTR